MAQMKSSLTADELIKLLISNIENKTIGNEMNKLPSEPELMEQFNVTRYTLRQALSQLNDMGYTFQEHGIGTFIRPNLRSDTEIIPTNIKESKYLSHQGRKFETRNANIKLIKFSEAEFSPIGSEINDSEELWSINRLRYVDNKPFIYEQSYYLKNVIPSIPEEALYGSLFEYIKKTYGLKLGFQDTTILSELMSPPVASFFNVPEKSAVLSVCDDSYLRPGSLFAFSKLSYNAKSTKVFAFKEL